MANETIEVLRIPGTLFPRGAFDENAFYKFLNIVESGGSGYVCLQPCTGIPVTNTAYWFKFCFKGDKGDAFTYADLTAEQKAELVRDATAAAQAAASSAQSAADDAAAALQKFNTIKAAIDAIDPQSTEGSIQTLAAKQGLLEADLNALGPKIEQVEEQINGKSNLEERQINTTASSTIATSTKYDLVDEKGNPFSIKVGEPINILLTDTDSVVGGTIPIYFYDSDGNVVSFGSSSSITITSGDIRTATTHNKDISKFAFYKNGPSVKTGSFTIKIWKKRVNGLVDEISDMSDSIEDVENKVTPVPVQASGISLMYNRTMVPSVGFIDPVPLQRFITLDDVEPIKPLFSDYRRMIGLPIQNVTTEPQYINCDVNVDNCELLIVSSNFNFIYIYDNI